MPSICGEGTTSASTARHCDRVIERAIRLQPGVIGQHANDTLRPYGRKIGPDPASIATARIGGMADRFVNLQQEIDAIVEKFGGSVENLPNRPKPEPAMVGGSR